MGESQGRGEEDAETKPLFGGSSDSLVEDEQRQG